MRSLALACVLVACGHHDAEYPREEHQCDPKGADVAFYVDPPTIEGELFPDEVALRGRCIEPASRGIDMQRNVSETVAMAEERARGERLRTCDGACEPYRAALPAIDEKHDLEDETFQRECASAVASLDEKIRGGCRHVCLVERRHQGARVLFARVMRGLDAFEAKVPPRVLGDAEVRRMWSDKTLALPPKRFRLTTTATDPPMMSAEGTMYPGGPALRLRLLYGSAGCGLGQWTVDAW